MKWRQILQKVIYFWRSIHEKTNKMKVKYSLNNKVFAIKAGEDKWSESKVVDKLFYYNYTLVTVLLSAGNYMTSNLHRSMMKIISETKFFFFIITQLIFATLMLTFECIKNRFSSFYHVILEQSLEHLAVQQILIYLLKCLFLMMKDIIFDISVLTPNLL